MKISAIFSFSVLMLILNLAFATAHAGELAIGPISVKFESNAEGQVIVYDKPTNDYGLDMNLLIYIRVKGKVDPSPAKSKVSLNVSAKAWSDVATGDHKDWNLDQSLTFKPLTENGMWNFLFTVPYQDCYSDAAFKVTVEHNKQTVSKTLNVNLACAE